MSKLTLIGTGTAIALVAIFGLSSCNTVDAGEIGLYNRYGQISEATASPGLHIVNPLTTSLETMNVQATRFNGNTPIYTQDLQTATVAYAVIYSLQPASAAHMRRSVGRQWEDRLIPPVIESSIKNVFGHFTAMNAVASRPRIQALVLQDLRQRFRARGINIEGFELTNIDYSDAFEHAVEQAQVATQQAVAARNQTAVVRERAVQAIARAEGQARAMQLRSQALEANPRLIEYEAVQKWNGILPQNYYGSAPLPFVNVGGR